MESYSMLSFVPGLINLSKCFWDSLMILNVSWLIYYINIWINNNLLLIIL